LAAAVWWVCYLAYDPPNNIPVQRWRWVLGGRGGGGVAVSVEATALLVDSAEAPEHRRLPGCGGGGGGGALGSAIFVDREQ